MSRAYTDGIIFQVPRQNHMIWSVVALVLVVVIAGLVLWGERAVPADDDHLAAASLKRRPNDTA